MPVRRYPGRFTLKAKAHLVADQRQVGGRRLETRPAELGAERQYIEPDEKLDNPRPPHPKAVVGLKMKREPGEDRVIKSQEEAWRGK